MHIRNRFATNSKSIRHLLEVKRACIGFDAHENNLQTPAIVLLLNRLCKTHVIVQTKRRKAF